MWPIHPYLLYHSRRGENIMALLNGQTPEEIAEEIVKQLEDRVIEVTGLSCQALESIARYDNRDSIANRGEKWYAKNKDHFEKVTLEKMLVAKKKQLDKYQEERMNTDGWKLFRLLVSKGVEHAQALEQSFPNGVPAPQK
jgi:hypothetical protein